MTVQFHLALPCLSISKTRAFYHDLLGAKIGRSSIKWIDVNFYDHQITFTESGPYNFESRSYAFNGQILPSFHFGVILDDQEWKKILNLLKSRNVEIVSEVNFLKDKTGEHHSFFVKDPNGYTVEFKCFTNSNEVFKS
jgi:extradiol dioxygenase family protein